MTHRNKIIYISLISITALLFINLIIIFKLNYLKHNILSAKNNIIETHKNTIISISKLIENLKGYIVSDSKALLEIVKVKTLSKYFQNNLNPANLSEEEANQNFNQIYSNQIELTKSANYLLSITDQYPSSNNKELNKIKTEIKTEISKFKQAELKYQETEDTYNTITNSGLFKTFVYPVIITFNLN